MTDIMNNASTNVRVVVRVRPPTDIEKNGQGKFVVEIMNENILIFDPKEEASPYSGKPGKRQLRDIRKRRHKDLKFAFDYVFGWNSDNDEVFEQSTKTLLNGLLDGYNCSVFAYGATGAGKTHTMLGTESQPGVIFHTMISLYKYISEMSADVICDVAVSYLEVYNEQIRDLLLPRGTLPIREDPDSGVIVPGLSLHKPSNAEELLYMLQFGNKNRTQHSTDANAESSRSHAVFQVFVRQRDRTASISTKVKVGKMCLVDLAGSERATVTNNRGARFREGANINRSLLALGNVINSLADQKSKSHISYRDSKLTRLLKDSLGGNCHTIMIAAISPSHLSYEDTYNTLKYADRAKHIRLDMKKNILNVDFHISQYGQIIKELRNEISELKDKLQKYEGPKLCPSLSLPADLQSLLGSLKTTYDDRCMLREQQLQREIRVSDIHWRLHCKQKCLYRASQLLSPRPEMLQKIHGIVQDLQKKLTGEEVQHKALTQKLQDNTEKLNCLQSKATVIDNKTSLYSQLFEVSSQKLAVGMEVSDLRHYVHHLRRLTRAQEREAVASEALISSLLHLVKLQHTELQHHGTLAPDIAIGYQRVYDLVGQWGVSWVDSENHGQREPFHINSVIDIPLLMSGSVNKTNGTLGCPGRVIGGQVLYPTSPRTANLQMVHAQKSPDVKPTVWREKENASTLNIHAGHTPNANKMGQNSKSASSWITPSQAASDHNQLQLVENLANDLLLTTAVRNDIVSNKLTETSETSGPVCKKDDCTLVLNKPSLQSVSVIDAAQSQSAKHLPLNSLCLNTDRVLAVKNLDSSASQTQILVNSDSCQQAQNSVLSLQMCLHQEVLASKGTCSPTDEGGICAASISGKKDSQMNKENSISCQRQNYNVKRAINFDIVNSSPLRVEGRSYADAVRTPTPTRLPLQNIDNNSPGFLPTATTTKMSKISENEIAGYQPLDNMQCFKQLGMPSLVENLIIGSRSGQNQPSYMHPTRATSQRVRQPSQTRDDSFQPKRIKHKNLFHNRSKSTSVLTKLGWKI